MANYSLHSLFIRVPEYITYSILIQYYRGTGVRGVAKAEAGEVGESGAHAGAAWLWQRMLLDRSILADAAVRRRVCGNRACATARPSGQIRAAAGVCGRAGEQSRGRAHAGVGGTLHCDTGSRKRLSLS